MRSRPFGVRRSLAVSKRDCLLFDRMQVMGLTRQIAELAEVDRRSAADAIFLAENEFLVEAPETARQVGLMLGTRLPVSDRLGGELPLVERMFNSGIHPSASDRPPLPFGAEHALSFALNALGDACIPVAERRPTRQEWAALGHMLFVPDSLSPGGQLLEIVIDALPVPADDVPLEDVLAFGRDPESVGRRERLMLMLARAQLEAKSADAFALDLEEALHAYAEHMAVAEMRTKTGSMRIAIGASLGVIEELIRLRPRRALDAVFEYRELKANRLEAELYAEGNETAFIYEARRAFGPSTRR